jgi:molybdate transport repressor ModE-like protein
MIATLRIEGRIEFGDVSLPLGETLAILDGIAERRALGGAAGRTGLSYRAIWGKLARLEQAFGQPLAAKTKGHGTALTPAGEALRAALADALRNLEAPMRLESESFAARLRRYPAASSRPLRLAASHDPLLLEAAGQVAGLHVATCGSAEALAALNAGTAELAGCHFGTPAATPPTELQRRFEAEGLRAVALFRRAQGLIVAPGNPLRLRGVGDIARRQARFVNRQRGSGTRVWFDRLLAEARIAPSAIPGYADEEFTHQAVAAVVAAGHADAAMGVRAAADRFRLGFHAIGEETYFLVAKAADLRDARVVDLVRRVREATRRVGGYASRGSAVSRRRPRRDA